MKKVLFIAVAVMMVAGCGQRRASKSQESGKTPCQKEEMEVVGHACCGHHGEGACESGKLEKACDHAAQKIEDACDKIEKAAEAVEAQADKIEAEGAKIQNQGKRPKGERPRPVPKPKD